MKNILFIDVETYCEIDIRKSGSYRYIEDESFELMLVGYALNGGEIKVWDLSIDGQMPEDLKAFLADPEIIKCAHNANFERTVFKRIGLNIPINEWLCTAVKSSYCGLPIALAQVSSALKLGEKGKLSTGRALIKYFCLPCKPTKANNLRSRNLPEHAPEKWDEFILYLINDVVAGRAIYEELKEYDIPEFETENYINDQEINDRGVKIDTAFAKAAYKLNLENNEYLKRELKRITKLENPNSPAQLKSWIGKATGKKITTLAKDTLPKLIKETESDEVREVIGLRSRMAKTSTGKYPTMLDCVGADSRIRGLFQFYGAGATGRWAGRLVQPQNLPRNYLKHLKQSRNHVLKESFDTNKILYNDISSVLSQLIRTAFVPERGNVFIVADFSAIEARVIAWLAGEEWRNEVFKTHGKIYEASASMMFGVPIEDVTKGSELRQKGKIAELALGYGGSLGALKQMGGEAMGLSETQMTSVVGRWRKANKQIVEFWYQCEKLAKRAYVNKKVVDTPFKGIKFSYDGKAMHIHLPSGRRLAYWDLSLGVNKFGSTALNYKGFGLNRQWVDVDTYGGKIVENIVQAVARDILAYSISRIKQEGFKISMHVHDEVVCEVEATQADSDLSKVCDIMGEEIPWAKGLSLEADGFQTEFYKKD